MEWIRVRLIALPPINTIINYTDKTTLGRRQINAQTKCDFAYLSLCGSTFYTMTTDD